MTENKRLRVTCHMSLTFTYIWYFCSELYLIELNTSTASNWNMRRIIFFSYSLLHNLGTAFIIKISVIKHTHVVLGPNSLRLVEGWEQMLWSLCSVKRCHILVTDVLCVLSQSDFQWENIKGLNLSYNSVLTNILHDL